MVSVTVFYPIFMSLLVTSIFTEQHGSNGIYDHSINSIVQSAQLSDDINVVDELKTFLHKDNVKSVLQVIVKEHVAKTISIKQKTSEINTDLLHKLHGLQLVESDSNSGLVQHGRKNHGSLSFNKPIINKDCQEQIALAIIHLATKESWALQIFDSYGKPASGFLEGNRFWVGDYKECLGLHGNNIKGLYSKQVNITGRYCLASIGKNVTKPANPSMSTDINWGMCLPSACQDADFYNIISSVLNSSSTILNGLNCNEDKIPVTARAIVAFVIIGLFLLCMVIGTTYDLALSKWFWESDVPGKEEIDNVINDPNLVSNSVHSDDLGPLYRRLSTDLKPPSDYYTGWKKHLHTALMAFSIVNNTKKLFSTKPTPNNVEGLNGFRVLSLAWVILGHSFVFGFPYVRNSLYAITSTCNSVAGQPLLSSFFSVDSFFFMSGLLVTFHFLSLLRKDPTKLRSVRMWIMFYIHRYIRLTPIYMIILMINVCLSQYFSRGPFSVKQAGDVPNCEKRWWTNILYINNFWTLAENCIGWSWYLANDMQFYIISPLILIPLFLKPIIGLVILTCFLILQFVYRGVLASQDSYAINEVFLSANLTQMLQYLTSAGYQRWQNYYTVPYSRIGPYLMGMITGYAIYRYRIKPIRIPKLVVILNWVVCVILIFCLLYAPYQQSIGNPNSTSVKAAYNALCKALWGTACGWVIFALNAGHGGLAGQLLSWNGWTPISRLTYAAYLVHPIVIMSDFQNMMLPVYYGAYSMTYFFFSQWVLSYLFAYIASMTFEAPLLGLEKIILRR